MLLLDLVGERRARATVPETGAGAPIVKPQHHPGPRGGDQQDVGTGNAPLGAGR